MAAGAIKSQGSKLEIKTTGTTYEQVKGFISFSGLGGGSAAVIDVTDLNSPAKEKLMGLPDEGQVSCSFIYLPKDTGQVAVKAARGTQAATGFRITLSDATKFEFNAFVLTCEKSTGLDETVSMDVTLEVTGSVTEAPAP